MSLSFADCVSPPCTNALKTCGNSQMEANLNKTQIWNKTSFVRNLFLYQLIRVKFCTEHSNHDDGFVTRVDVIVKWYFTRFQPKADSGQVIYIVPKPVWGPFLLICFDVNSSMDKLLHLLYNVGLNYFSIPKHQRCNRCSLGIHFHNAASNLITHLFGHVIIRLYWDLLGWNLTRLNKSGTWPQNIPRKLGQKKNIH